ncbi:MAG: type II secretion system protein [Chthoniobacterales bacterium]
MTQTDFPLLSAALKLAKHRRSAAFSMIEILVVIMIVAILFTLLGVAVDRVKQSGLQVKNINNLRQIGIASLTYAGDNNGKLPEFSGGSSPAVDDTIITYSLAVRAPARRLFSKDNDQWPQYFAMGNHDYLPSVDVLYSPFVKSLQSRPKGELVGEPGRRWVGGYTFYSLPRFDERRSTPVHPEIFNDRLTESVKAPLYSDRAYPADSYRENFSSDTYNVLFLDGSVKAFDYHKVMSLPSWKKRLDYFAGKAVN